MEEKDALKDMCEIQCEKRDELNIRSEITKYAAVCDVQVSVTETVVVNSPVA